jgi:hypothetical protein
MGVPCLIEIEVRTWTPDKPHKTYTFACLPRVGEMVSLEWTHEGHPPNFVVYQVSHVPYGVDEVPAFTILHVRPVA